MIWVKIEQLIVSEGLQVREEEFITISQFFIVGDEGLEGGFCILNVSGTMYKSLETAVDAFC